MKKLIHISRRISLAIIFFGAMAFHTTTALHAQNDTDNPLFTTTGPNVLGEGRVQWNSSLDYYHINQVYSQYQYYRYNSFGVATGLRFGIGNRAELTLDVLHEYYVIETGIIDKLYGNGGSNAASVGVKLLIADGKRGLPQVAFFTNVGLLAVEEPFPSDQWIVGIQPTMGMMFRNRLSSRWVLDYMLGYSWTGFSEPGIDFDSQIQYAVAASWLASNRLSLGVGLSNINSAHRMGGDLEVRFLANPNLQFSFGLGVAMGFTQEMSDNNALALVGVHWTIR